MGTGEFIETILISNLIISMMNFTSSTKSIALNMKGPICINTFKMNDIPLSNMFALRGKKH